MAEETTVFGGDSRALLALQHAADVCEPVQGTSVTVSGQVRLVGSDVLWTLLLQ